MPKPKIIDTADTMTSSKLSALKKAGVETIIRYDDRRPRGGWKQIHQAEAKLIRDAGLRLGIVYEDAATASYFTRLEGSTRTSISTALWLASTEPTAHKYVRSASNGENSNRGVKTTKERPELTRIARIVALGAGLVISGSAFAQQYPSKPVKIIVPFPPAGVTDIVGRLVAEKLSEKLGQQFYIENISGAGGNLGMAQVAHSPGDGYAILFASSSIVVNPTLYSKIPFDIDKDFIPVTKAGATPNSWQVNPDFPASTMAALIDIIRKEPGKYSVASPGTGTTPSLSIEMLRLALGLNFVVVPFAGGGPMVQSLLGGHTPIACSAIANAMALIKDRKIRVLAITANKRVEFAPEIPTLDELGIKNQEAETMTGVFVPAGTPKPIVDLLQKEISTMVTTPEIKARLLELGVVPGGESSAQFAGYVKAEVAKWRKVITEAKVPPIGG